MKTVSDGDAFKTLYWIIQGANSNWKDVNSKTKYSVLHEACAFGELACVAILLANGANVNVTDASNHTPLYYAKRNKFTEM